MRDVGSKRKTKKAAQDRDLKKGNCKLVSITREDLARKAFEIEFIQDYVEKHPDVKWLPEDEKRKMKEIFDQRVKTTHAKIVEEYHEKYPLDLFSYTHSKIIEEYHEKYPLDLFNSDPCFKVKFIELYKKSKKATSEIIEVNRDVAEASSKNTMNQNKRKTTTTQASIVHHESEQKEDNHYSYKSKISEGHLEKLTDEFRMLVA